MKAILENETLSKVMNFILDNIWIIGLCLAIIVVIILIIIFSKKRPVEINDNSTGNVGEMIEVNQNLENNMLTSDDLVDTNIDNGNNLVNIRGADDPQTDLENLRGDESVEILANTGNELSITPDTIEDFKAMANETEQPEPIETLNTLPQNDVSGMIENVNDEVGPTSSKTEPEINAFDMPMPKENQQSDPLGELSITTSAPVNGPEITSLEDTLELPKMASDVASASPLQTKKCQSCGHANNAAFKVCVKCGNILE